MSSLSDKQIYFNDCTEELLASHEVKRMEQFMQHGQTTCLQHSLSVAYNSYLLCMLLKINFDSKSIIRGALLHDFFLYDWHERSDAHRLHGFTHPRTALNNALTHFELNELECDIILNHMWPLTIRLPKYKETLIVCAVDKYCSVVETFSICYHFTLRHIRRLYSR